jgi:hypothetical protein
MLQLAEQSLNADEVPIQDLLGDAQEIRNVAQPQYDHRRRTIELVQNGSQLVGRSERNGP